jgi:hypothetical protein
MALNFPNSPTDGEIYTDTTSGNRWVWDSANSVWTSTSTFTQTITVSSTQPGSPVVGQLWWNKDYGRLFIYYNDGNSNQWVDATLSPDISGIYGVANAANLVASASYNTANAAFGRANTALQNTSGTFAGSLNITGYVNDASISGTGEGIRIVRGDGNPFDSFVSTSNSANTGLAFRSNYHTFRNVTNTTEFMRIDSSGRLTTPNQPAFMVYDNAIYTTNQTPVVWDQVNLNNGNHYNTTNGRFTAPVTGMYHFTCTIQARNTGAKQAYFRVNGSDYWRFGYVSSVSNDDGPAFTGSMIRSLNSGDYVDVRLIIGGGDAWLNDISCFSGFLLG